MGLSACAACILRASPCAVVPRSSQGRVSAGIYFGFSPIDRDSFDRVHACMRNLQYSSDAFRVNIWSSGTRTRRSMAGSARAVSAVVGRGAWPAARTSWMMSPPSARVGHRGQARIPRLASSVVGGRHRSWIGLDVVGDLLQLCVASAHWVPSYLWVFFRAGQLGSATYMIISVEQSNG